MINEDLPPCSPNKATDVCVLLAYSPILHMKTEGDPHKVPVSWTVNFLFFSVLGEGAFMVLGGSCQNLANCKHMPEFACSSFLGHLADLTVYCTSTM